MPLVPSVSIAAEQRFEVGTDAAVSLHQIRVEIENDAPPEDADVEAVRANIAETIDAWLQECLTGVSGQELTHAELLAGDAVVEGVLQETPRVPQ